MTIVIFSFLLYPYNDDLLTVVALGWSCFCLFFLRSYGAGQENGQEQPIASCLSHIHLICFGIRNV
jgi:hypothetical protein